MALSELVKYEGDNSTFIWKYPNEDFNCMTELVVHEGQEAIFYANGQNAVPFNLVQPVRFCAEHSCRCN